MKKAEHVTNDSQTGSGSRKRSVYFHLSSAGETDSLSIYLKQIAKYPLLTRPDELVLGEKIQKTQININKLEAKFSKNRILKKDFIEGKGVLTKQLNEYKNRMITSNLRLVVSIAKKYRYRGLGLLDLINEGNLGLIEAVDRFDYTKGCRFSTYGTWWIQQAITKSLSDKGRSIRIPMHILSNMRKCFSASKYLHQKYGRVPLPEELADFMQVPREKIEIYQNLFNEIASLDTTIDDGNMTSLLDLISDNENKEPFEQVFDVTLQNTIAAMLMHLNHREKVILQLRFGLAGEGPMTLETIGNRFGITRERVRQIQNDAIRKLKKCREIKDLKDVCY
ncbi:MAG: RNA polymerase sigma factor RpoD/SigA [Spirochaetota bacterium]